MEGQRGGEAQGVADPKKGHDHYQFLLAPTTEMARPSEGSF
jgi:hypothetical protein